ncbi:hypothetical protein [Flagellimonas flava]|uniref:hypothetical protein n=1 Tax=Flagellimonas flava TaxID=570519 RepID=UPI001041C216|nr:hypothetical protein [Allomuricauda flava]
MRTQPITKLLLLLCLYGSFWGVAQEKQHFRGPLTVGQFQGEAEYDFQVVEGDTILDGPFSMIRSNLNALLEDKDNFFSFIGGFKNGYPNGDWNFQFGEFQSGEGTKVIDLQYRLNVSGTTNGASGTISMGRPNGLWTFDSKKIENSEIEEKLFSSTITFENGIPQKSFKIENETSTLVGRFLRNGLAHDVWTLYTDNDSGTSESWFFDNGLLRKVEKLNDAATEAWSLYGSSLPEEKVINLDARYLKILQLWNASLGSIELETTGISQLLAQNAGHYKEIDDILSAMGKSQFLPEFKVKVGHYPLDSLETGAIESLEKLYARSSEISQSLLNDTQLNILRRSDGEAQFLYAVTQELHTRFLEPNGKLLDYKRENLLEFIPRKQLLDYLWPKGMPSPTLEILNSANQMTRSFSGPDLENYDVKALDILSAEKMLQYASSSLDSIAKLLNDRLQKESRLQEVIGLEETMIANVDHLNKLTDSLQAQTSRLESKALKKIQSFAEDQLKSYSNMEDSPEKVEQGKQIMKCLEQLDGLALKIANLPSKWEHIQETYMDAVWNPFMANIMNEEVKKRITGAYKNVLIPHVLNKVIDGLNCGNAQNISNLLTNLDQRMLELRDADTSKLERKLRKEKNPATILNLFNLQSLED